MKTAIGTFDSDPNKESFPTIINSLAEAKYVARSLEIVFTLLEKGDLESARTVLDDARQRACALV